MGLHNVAGTPSNCATHNQPQHEHCHNQFDFDWFSNQSPFSNFSISNMSGVPSDPSIKFGTCRCKVWQLQITQGWTWGQPLSEFWDSNLRGQKGQHFQQKGVCWQSLGILEDAVNASKTSNLKKHDDNEDSGGPRQWFSISDRTTENVNLPVCTRNAGNKFYPGRKLRISIFITNTNTINKFQIVTQIISTSCFPFEPFAP